MWNLKNKRHEQMLKHTHTHTHTHTQIRRIDTENKLVVTRQQIGGRMSEIAEGDSMYKILITK